MTFTPNRDRHAALREPTDASIQHFGTALTRISKSHRGRPQAEILEALLSAAQDAGFKPNESDLTQLAQHLSEGPNNASY